MGPRAGGLGARFRETLPRSAGCVDVAPLTVRHRYDCGSVQDGDAPSRGLAKREVTQTGRTRGSSGLGVSFGGRIFAVMDP